MRKLFSDEVTFIITLLNNSKSSREIARIIGYGKFAIEIYPDSVGNEVPDRKSGRLQKLTSRDKQAIARLLVNGSAKTAVEFTNLINNEREDRFLTKTFRRALKDEGLKVVKRKKTHVSQKLATKHD